MNTNIADLPSYRDPLQVLLNDIALLEQRILSATEKEMADFKVDTTSREHLYSVINLMNYVVMRREDPRALQERLATAGLHPLNGVSRMCLPV